MDDQIDHMVFHVQFDGDILPVESDDKMDQDEYWDQKEIHNKKMLALMNKEVISEFGKDPLEDDKRAQRKSLRN